MKLFNIIILSVAIAAPVMADTQVRGYTRSNGTYVQGYTRSSPDGIKSNNYGAASGSRSSGIYSLGNGPQTRDSDHDGIPNQYDLDDNNNGVPDNNE